MWRHQIRCSDSKFPGHRSDHSSPPPSPVARLAFLRRAPRLRDRAWRSVACYRSGTVAGFHGIPSILRRKAKALGARTKILKNQSHPNEPSNSVNRSSVLRPKICAPKGLLSSAGKNSAKLRAFWAIICPKGGYRTQPRVSTLGKIP
jgi:hypothetical protein